MTLKNRLPDDFQNSYTSRSRRKTCLHQ